MWIFSSRILNNAIGSKPKSGQTRSLQLTTKKHTILYNDNLRNIRSNTIVTTRVEEGEGRGEGVLKLRNAGCLLYVLLLTTRCFSYQ